MNSSRPENRLTADDIAEMRAREEEGKKATEKINQILTSHGVPLQPASDALEKAFGKKLARRMRKEGELLSRGDPPSSKE